MKVIVPCAGRSSRYPKQPPKWMLPANDGTPMIRLAVSGLTINPKDLIVTILQEHEERFAATRGLRETFGDEVTIIVLPDQTSSQSETVAETIKRASLNEPFLVKDSDNTFKISPADASYNYVSVASLNDFDMINPRNKSYVAVDHEDDIVNIREKQVISDLFSVGGYFFRDPHDFVRVFEKLKSGSSELGPSEIYLSEVISWMILNGTPFRARRVEAYQDWGTIVEWKRQLDRQQTYFLSLDGLVLQRGSHYFAPKFEDVKPIPAGLAAAKRIAAAGHRIVYLSIRPRALAELTQIQLHEAGAPKGEILFDCPVSRWSLVTTPHPTLPFATSSAKELAPDDPMLEEKLEI